MKATFLILAALIGAPQPAPAYRQPIGGETADAMLQQIIENQGEAPAEPAADFNGDGVLSIADYTGSTRRHHITTANGSEVTADGATVEAIAAEIFPGQELIYYEFDCIGGQYCRKYEVTAAEIITVDIYFEFADWSTTARAEINPRTETITIIEEA